MSGPKEFKILLDNNSSTFFGGQKVGGFVHIENVSRLDDIKGKLSWAGLGEFARQVYFLE